MFEAFGFEPKFQCLFEDALTILRVHGLDLLGSTRGNCSARWRLEILDRVRWRANLSTTVWATAALGVEGFGNGRK